MSGPKAYTMREMKGIVEYLVEHKAFSEYRGRKMWMDFANTSQTTRSWQSLKETFLKRILPDIQNPYYQLTRDQVCSFKQGTDVEAKEKNNRLEIVPVADGSSNNEVNQKEIEEPSTSAEKNNEADKTLGENIKSATISVRNRSSADTYIIDENSPRTSRDEPVSTIKSTKDLLADLEDPPAKSLKEYLTFEYSAPPSVVTDVINDFGTESEGSDNCSQMKIVENIPDENTVVEQEAIVVEDSIGNVEYIEEERIIVEGGMEVDIGPTFDHEIVTEVTRSEIEGIALKNWMEDCVRKEQDISAERNEDDETDNVQEPIAEPEDVEDASINRTRKETEAITVEDDVPLTENQNEHLNTDDNNQTSLNTTSDTIIPNNQEVPNVEEIKSKKMNSKFDILAPLKDAASRKRPTSQDETLSKKQKIDDVVEPKTNDTTIDKSPPSSNNTEALFDAIKKSDNPVDQSTLPDAQDVDESPEIKNPCLKSVSLFEEQFNTTKYSDSEEDTPIPNNKEKLTDNTPSVENGTHDKPPSGKNEEIVHVDPPLEEKLDITAKIDPPTEKQQNKLVKIDLSVDKTVKTVTNSWVQTKRDVIVLKSDSECDVSPLAEQPKERFKHLAQAFGFVPGTSKTAAQRRRSLRSRNRTKSQRNSCTLHNPSDWEGSVSEPELADGYISPPGGRRNRLARKYKKPQPGGIMSLEEDGGLFVVHDNKIIPLVKNGKTLTFVTYDSLGCSEEEEELMWRQKYIDMKKNVADLKRQLNELQAEARTSHSKSPILQNPLRYISSAESSKTVQKQAEIDMNKQMHIKQIGDSGKIQITLTKNSEETINLEGHWPQVLPIVQQVMSMFYKPEEASTAPDNQKKREDSSGLDTPIIPVIDLDTRKVDDLEREIFKEIAVRDNMETVKSSKKSPKMPTPIKSRKVVQKDIPENSETDDKTKMEKLEVNTDKSKKVANADPKMLTHAEEPIKRAAKRKVTEAKDKMADNELTDKESLKTVTSTSIEPRITRSRKSGNDTDSSTRNLPTRLSPRHKTVAEEDIRYMLPPEPKARKSTSKVTPNKSRSSENPHEILQDRFRTSIDSSQGYQDSDASPAKVNSTRRKRKVSVTVRKGKYTPRRKSLPTVTAIHEASLDSSNSSYFVPKKSNSHSTLDSNAYKTESYEILMENRKLSIKKLDPINETSKSDDSRDLNGMSKDSSDNSNIVIELGSSSNVSLPLSPELSVVEDLSISRDMIHSENHPTINEIQANDSVVNNIYNQYLISELDASVPLMQQDCELLSTQKQDKSRVKKQKTPVKVSGLIKKMCTVNMSVNNTLSDSLDKRLRDLLLESAQKISGTDKESLMDVDESKVEPKKTRGKKRSSTPLKKNITKKRKHVIEPVIDEYMESCSHGGRNSCPPVITFIPLDENANNSADVQLKTKPKPRARAKKDIIKVKIQRPKRTKKSAKDIPDTPTNTSQISVYTDSGINETVSISGRFQSTDSVELIHNHSETCLQANECIGDSIEFVENSKSESVISINSTASLESKLLEVMEHVENLSGDYRSRVQNSSAGKSSGEVFGTPTDTVYHSPVDVATDCSFLTDDLSGDAPIEPTKWYLLSEDDTNNTNMRPELMTSNSRASNISANLKQLFPITCAVPDLSTISEMSKENEGSQKGFDTDGDTRSSDCQWIL